MITRIAFIGAAALILSASVGSAQGHPQKQVVISKAVLKSMVANKPKSKRPLGATIGIVARKNVTAARSPGVAPTSVREASKKK